MVAVCYTKSLCQEVSGRRDYLGRAPIYSNGLVSSRAPVHLNDIVRLTGEVLEDETENNTNEESLSPKQSGKGSTGKGRLVKLGNLQLMLGNG